MGVFVVEHLLHSTFAFVQYSKVHNECILLATIYCEETIVLDRKYCQYDANSSKV